MDQLLGNICSKEYLELYKTDKAFKERHEKAIAFDETKPERDKDGLTALHWAARMGHTDIVKKLLNRRHKRKTNNIFTG